MSFHRYLSETPKFELIFGWKSLRSFFKKTFLFPVSEPVGAFSKIQKKLLHPSKKIRVRLRASFWIREFLICARSWEESRCSTQIERETDVSTMTNLKPLCNNQSDGTVQNASVKVNTLRGSASIMSAKKKNTTQAIPVIWRASGHLIFCPLGKIFFQNSDISSRTLEKLNRVFPWKPKR